MYPFQKNNITPFFEFWEEFKFSNSDTTASNLYNFCIHQVSNYEEFGVQGHLLLLDLRTVDVLTLVAGEDGVLGDRIISSLGTAQGLYLSISVLDKLCWPQRSGRSLRPLVIFIFILSRDEIPEWKKKIKSILLPSSVLAPAQLD